MKYIILAGGEGTRLIKEGQKASKPMTLVFNEPMIGRLFHLLRTIDAEEIVVVINENLNDAIEYLDSLKSLFPSILKIVSVPNINNFYSLSKGFEKINGRFVALTVDSIFPTNEFLKYIDSLKALKENEVLMGITGYVDDEIPLYANVSNNEIIDYRYGGRPFPTDVFVSAGIYALSTDILRDLCQIKIPESLNEMQKLLALNEKFLVTPFVFSKAMDIDHVSDIEKAERFLESR